MPKRTPGPRKPATLAEWMEAAGLNDRQVAENLTATGCRVSTGMVAYIRRGMRTGSPRIILALSRLTGLSAESLLSNRTAA